MARLIWGSTGARYYEAGADRGVLYLPGVDGVPWNGLTAVKEAIIGGEARPFYIDGFKYINLAAAEEFGATIEAFSSPREFDVCDGTASISSGLFITQQPRKPFGLSYRTRLGNDTNGLDLGYKIHLVYGALAAPTSRDNKTISTNAEPNMFSWDITTLAPRITGFRPSAHLVLDSTKTPAVLLATLEDILYGSVSQAPRLPTQDELRVLIATGAPIVRRNLVGHARATNAGWASYNPASSGLVATETMFANATDGPLLPDGTLCTSYARYTATTAANVAGNTPYFYLGSSTAAFPLLPAGAPVMVGIYVRSSVAGVFRANCYLYKDTVVQSSTGVYVDTPVAANEWTYVANMRTPSGQFNAARASAYCQSPMVALGQTIDITAGIVDPLSRDITPFFDGLTLPADGYSYGYEGTPPDIPSFAKSWGPI